MTSPKPLHFTGKAAPNTKRTAIMRQKTEAERALEEELRLIQNERQERQSQEYILLQALKLLSARAEDAPSEPV